MTPLQRNLLTAESAEDVQRFAEGKIWFFFAFFAVKSSFLQ